MRIEPDSPGPPSVDYVERVNRAIDHIVRNLETELSLAQLARVAHFSPFHFHRVFRALVGETLNQFVRRLRLERALSLMGNEPGRSLTNIALACGFGSSSDFSRAFRQGYGIAPSAFDLDAFREQRRAELQHTVTPPEQRHLLARLPPGKNPDGFEVRLRELPARTVAYIRVLDPFRGTAVPAAAQRLVAWAEARGCADNQWLGYMWDDPDLVALADCRYDVGVVVDEVQPHGLPDGEIGCFGFPAMVVAEVEVCGGIDLELRAFDWLSGTWLPRSGRLPTDQPCFEAWRGRPFAHGFERFELCVQLPVRRA